MKIGAILPQKEIGLDGGALRAYAEAAEDLGYHHLLAFDSVFIDNPYHEPLVLFGLLAGCTRRIELVTGIVVAPSRQTILLAKQATSLDILSGGRLRLGLGVGWNRAEYAAMNVDFRGRGLRFEEQMMVLRRLWTEPSVTFQGRWHHFTETQLQLLPVQRPIPLWLGGFSDVVIERAGRLANGWMPVDSDPTNPERYEELHRQITLLKDTARAAGRAPDELGIEAQAGVRLRWGNEENWAAHAQAWRALGATHLSVTTLEAGLTGVDAHIDALARMQRVLG